MSTPQDIAFGRLAMARGLVAREHLQQLHAQLPPGRSLAQVLVERRLLTPQQAQRVWQELSGQGPVGPLSDSTATLAAPAGAHSDSSVTVAAPTPPSGGNSSSDSGTGGLPVVGERIAGRYEVVSILGKGGMGAVYRALDTQLQLEVALKVLLPGADAAGTAVERFEREAQAMRKVERHAGVVRIRDAGLHGPLPFAVMNLVEGSDLRSRVKEMGPLPIEEAARLIEQVARAVEHCHQQGILHRDLKPANVLVQREDGQPFVTDFGLVRDAEAERLTKTGQVLGTPSYMSPEQADGDWDAIDARTDVYGLGATLYELLVGEPPFRGDGMQVLKKVLLDPPVPPIERRDAVPADLSAICCKALAKDPNQRYATAADMAEDLAAFGRGDPLTVRVPGWWEHTWWGVRRKQPRALATVFGPPITLLVVGALVAVIVFFQSYRGQALDELRARATEAQALVETQDPLLVESEQATAARELLLATLGSAAAVAGQGEGEPAKELNDEELERLSRWIEVGPVARALTPAQAQAVQRLMRRCAVEARLKAPWEAIGPEPEDQLFVALKLLAWRRNDLTVSHQQAVMAEEALTKAALGSSPVASATATLRKRIAAAQFDMKDYLEFGASDRLLWETRAWTKRAASLELLQQKHSDLRRALPTLARGPVDAAFKGLIGRQGRLRPLSRWKQKQPYEAVKEWYLRRVMPLLEEQADLRRVVTPLLSGMAVNAKVAVATGGLKHLLDLLRELQNSVDWSDRELQRSIVDLGAASVELVLSSGRDLDAALMELMPRVGRLPVQNSIRAVIKRMLPALRRHAQAAKTGDAWLIFAAASDEAGKEDVKSFDRYLPLFGRAMGSRLSPAERSALLKDDKPPEPLERSMTSMWEPWVRYRIGHLAVRRSCSTHPPDLARARAGVAVLLKVWSSGAIMPRGVSHITFLRHSARSLHQVWELTKQSELKLQARRMISEGERRAWRRLEKNVRGGSSPTVAEGAAGSLFDLEGSLEPDKNEYDWVNQLKTQLGLYWPDDVAEATRIYDAAQARLKELRHHTSSILELHFLIRAVHYGGPAELKRGSARIGPLRAELQALYDRQATDDKRRKVAGRIGESEILQARLALAAGDINGARAIYLKARGSGGTAYKHRWWGEFVLPFVCRALIAAKRRGEARELYKLVMDEGRKESSAARGKAWDEIAKALSR